MTLNLFQVLPNTFIQESLATRTIYENLDSLYELDNEVRIALLDLLRLSKLKLFHGIVYAFGYNETSQLGTGDFSNIKIPTPVNFSTITDRDGKRKKVIQVEAGYRHSLFLCEDGSVYSCGENYDGRLGTGNNNHALIPTEIDTTNLKEKRVIQVSVGNTHSLFLCEDGSVYSCGENEDGQLGTGDTDRVAIPTEINTSNMDGKRVIQVAAGGRHSLILCEDGTVYSFGFGRQRQLGTGNSNNVAIPTEINTSNMDGKRVIQVSGGSFHSLILCEDGSVYSCGWNKDGQLGTDNTNNEVIPIPTEIDTTNLKEKRVIQVSARSRHSLILCEDGTVYSFGWNERGQLGTGNTDDEVIPTLINTTKMGGEKVIQVSAGGIHSLLLCEEGTVYSFGYNRWGQGGTGTSSSTNNVEIPTAINTSLMDGQQVIDISAGSFHSLILT